MEQSCYWKYLSINADRALLAASHASGAPCGSSQPSKDGTVVLRGNEATDAGSTSVQNIPKVNHLMQEEGGEQRSTPDYSSGSLGLCSSNLGMYSMVSSRDDQTESCVTPGTNIKTSSFIDCRLRRVIKAEINQMLFASSTSTNSSTISKSSSFSRSSRRYQSLREGRERRRHYAAVCYNDNLAEEHAKCKLTHQHIIDEINHIVRAIDFNRLSPKSVHHEGLSFLSPEGRYEDTCVQPGKRPPCEGKEASPRLTLIENDIRPLAQPVHGSDYIPPYPSEPSTRPRRHKRRFSCCLGSQTTLDSQMNSSYYQESPPFPPIETSQMTSVKSPDVNSDRLSNICDITIKSFVTEPSIISTRSMFSRRLRKLRKTFKRCSLTKQ